MFFAHLMVLNIYKFAKDISLTSKRDVFTEFFKCSNAENALACAQIFKSNYGFSRSLGNWPAQNLGLFFHFTIFVLLSIHTFVELNKV